MTLYKQRDRYYQISIYKAQKKLKNIQRLNLLCIKSMLEEVGEPLNIGK